LIYLNNFIGSHAGGRDARYIWDNGTIGNYWSDYNGTDQNNDGIGDVPYSFNAFSSMGLGDIINIDNYPLMKPPVNIEAILDFPDEEEPSPYASPEPQPEPFPTVPVLAAFVIVVVIVVAGLLVYHMRRQRSQSS
jgi:hypothetical protein